MRNILFVAAILHAAGALAADSAPPPVTDPAAAPTAALTAASSATSTVAPAAAPSGKQPDLTRLQEALNGEKPDSVAPTAIPGLYEVVLGGQVLYLSEDGRFAVQGDMVDLGSRANLTENRRGELRGKAIAAVGESNMVVFAPEGPVKHTVTIFTDIDCGYCRKMHSQIADYNKEGIKIRYLMFPREGIGSESYHKAVSIWCANNRQEAMTKAKRGESIEPKTCDNPVQAQYELGDKLGVRGTPSMVLESGEMLPGYVPPAQLARLLAETRDKAIRPTIRP
ncbi:MAG: DsbC family protein [Candidatus Contendobacter sp.]|nr:DsbC family protein [Candidatus Contendobacter sp.]MDS4058725.1 DsbC family protein [Candidatus Contendobacter sp.]